MNIQRYIKAQTIKIGQTAYLQKKVFMQFFAEDFKLISTSIEIKLRLKNVEGKPTCHSYR